VISNLYQVILHTHQIVVSIESAMCQLAPMREFQIRKSRSGVSSSLTRRKGFTLLELLISMVIMTLIFWLTLPALHSFNSAKSVTASTADIQDILTQARTQAMLRNSYVYVGFYESDGSKPDATRPAPTGTGRVWVGVAASRDSLTNAASWSATNLTPVDKLHFFDNLHLATTASFFTTNSTNNTISPVLNSSVSNAPFGWPVENSNTVTQFSTGVIQFTPQGTAMLPGDTTLAEYIQIALIPTHGNLLASNTSNAAVIQIDAITGAVRSYRP
jgi:prepilin-type N-terminal cleavage/methylation domain-containing protein